MNFQPKTEEQLMEENLLPEGEYDFEVVDAKDDVSKSQNEMIVLKLKVFGNDGSFRYVTDYLLESMAFKLRHFCEATGLLDKYEAATLYAEDCKDKCGKVKLKIDPAGQYPSKNSVKDYIVLKAGEATKNAPKFELDDEIPFGS